MILARTERDNYVVTATTDPPLDGTWEASFDGGATYVEGTPTDGDWAWLVAGPDFVGEDVGMDDADTVAVIATTTTPLLRLKDDPVLDVEPGPIIKLWG